MGCFNDNNGSRDIRDYVYMPRENTNKVCIFECYNRNFSYAATQEAYKLFNLFIYFYDIILMILMIVLLKEIALVLIVMVDMVYQAVILIAALSVRCLRMEKNVVVL